MARRLASGDQYQADSATDGCEANENNGPVPCGCVGRLAADADEHKAGCEHTIYRTDSTSKLGKAGCMQSFTAFDAFPAVGKIGPLGATRAACLGAQREPFTS
eukprot:4048807-Prymnesium_polylepis.1